jgi:antitoxin (DNA-binding transcriptional repressor) of toxin-antitoxin stability system
MKVTITKFRRNLFQRVKRVIAGETVEFVHQGATIRLVMPEGATPSKLGRLTPRQTVNPKLTEKQRAARKKFEDEMWAEIEKDWAEI